MSRMEKLEEIIRTSDIDAFNDLLSSTLADTKDVDKVKEYCDIALRLICLNSPRIYDVVYEIYDTAQLLKENIIVMIIRLLECGGQVDSICRDLNPLCLAVDAGNYPLTELFCQYGADVNRPLTVNEKKPVSIAVLIGRYDIIELLLKYKADINMLQFYGSPLDCAFRNDNSECVKFLMQRGAQLDLKEALVSATKHQVFNYFNTVLAHEGSHTLFKDAKYLHDLLILAVRGENLQIIGRIIDAGAIVNPPISTEEIPLVECRNGKVAALLIQRGANVHRISHNEYGSVMPLYHILRSRQWYDPSIIEIVPVLLQNGADVGERDKKGRTPLMVAASKKKNESMLRILLDHGADCWDKDAEGKTALMFAMSSKCDQNESFLRQHLKEKSRFISLQNQSGVTTWLCDTNWKFFRTNQMVTGNCVDVKHLDRDGNTALHVALIGFTGMYKNEEGSLTSLIKAGSDVNWQNKNGLSPLMIAVKNGLPRAISILAKHGADVNAVSEKNPNNTAISFLRTDSCVVSSRALSCIQALLEYGASTSYMKHHILYESIYQDQIGIVPKVIRSGLAPIDISFKIPNWSSGMDVPIFLISPLCLALMTDNVALAEYFVEKSFLTQSDVSSMKTNKDLWLFLALWNNWKCMHFVDELRRKPFSLYQLAFVTVVSAVGSSPGRERRVNKLPLPRPLKDALLFKYEDEEFDFPSKGNYKLSEEELGPLILKFVFALPDRKT